MERPGRDLAAKRTGETSTSGQLPSSLQALHDAVMAHLLPMQDALKEHPDVARALLRWWTACTRGAALGLTVRGGLHLLSSLMWALRTAAPNKRKVLQPQRGLSAGEMARDTWRYTFFLAALGGTYVAADESIAMVGGRERTAKWRALVAGLIAGQTMLLTGSHVRHPSLATYVFVRGLTLLIRCGNKPPSNGLPPQGRRAVIRWLLAPTRMTHGDVVLMCAAAAQIVYSYIMMPGTLPPSYIRFLNKQAAKPLFVWSAVREQALRNWKNQPPGPLKTLHNTPWHDCAGKTPCEFWHPGQSCTGHAINSFPSSYLRSLAVYIPVYVVPAILVHRQKLLRDPLPILPKLALGIARSSLFLTGFITLAFAGACLGFTITGTSTGPVIGAFTAAGGLATLLEKKSRRMELALYCFSRALESFARCLSEWRVVPTSLIPARLDVLLFSVGCAAITHCYSDSHGQHRDVFRSKYLSVLDAVFGNTGLAEGHITHHPSNRDLITTVHRRLKSMSVTRLDALVAGGSPESRSGHSTSRLSSCAETADDTHPGRRVRGAMTVSASLPALHAATIQQLSHRLPPPHDLPVYPQTPLARRAAAPAATAAPAPAAPAAAAAAVEAQVAVGQVLAAEFVGNGRDNNHNHNHDNNDNNHDNNLNMADTVLEPPVPHPTDVERRNRPLRVSSPDSDTGRGDAPATSAPLAGAVAGPSRAASAGVQGSTDILRVRQIEIWDRAATYPPAFGGHGSYNEVLMACASDAPPTPTLATTSPAATTSIAASTSIVVSTSATAIAATAAVAAAAGTAGMTVSMYASETVGSVGSGNMHVSEVGVLSASLQPEDRERGGGYMAHGEDSADGPVDKSVRGGRIRGIGGMRGVNGFRRTATAPCLAVLAQSWGDKTSSSLTKVGSPLLDSLHESDAPHHSYAAAKADADGHTHDTTSAWGRSLPTDIMQAGGSGRSESEGRVHGTHVCGSAPRGGEDMLADQCVHGWGSGGAAAAAGRQRRHQSDVRNSRGGGASLPDHSHVGHVASNGNGNGSVVGSGGYATTTTVPIPVPNTVPRSPSYAAATAAAVSYPGHTRVAFSPPGQASTSLAASNGGGPHAPASPTHVVDATPASILTHTNPLYNDQQRRSSAGNGGVFLDLHGGGSGSMGSVSRGGSGPMAGGVAGRVVGAGDLAGAPVATTIATGPTRVTAVPLYAPASGSPQASQAAASAPAFTSSLRRFAPSAAKPPTHGVARMQPSSTAHTTVSTIAHSGTSPTGSRSQSQSPTQQQQQQPPGRVASPFTLMPHEGASSGCLSPGAFPFGNGAGRPGLPQSLLPVSSQGSLSDSIRGDMSFHGWGLEAAAIAMCAEQHSAAGCESPGELSEPPLPQVLEEEPGAVSGESAGNSPRASEIRIGTTADTDMAAVAAAGTGLAAVADELLPLADSEAAVGGALDTDMAEAVAHSTDSALAAPAEEPMQPAVVDTGEDVSTSAVGAVSHPWPDPTAVPVSNTITATAISTTVFAAAVTTSDAADGFVTPPTSPPQSPSRGSPLQFPLDTTGSLQTALSPDRRVRSSSAAGTHSTCSSGGGAGARELRAEGSTEYVPLPAQYGGSLPQDRAQFGSPSGALSALPYGGVSVSQERSESASQLQRTLSVASSTSSTPAAGSVGRTSSTGTPTRGVRVVAPPEGGKNRKKHRRHHGRR